MSEQLDRIESLLVSFIEQTSGKFEQIESRFDKVDARLDQHDARFDAVQAQLDRMEQAQHDDIIAVLKITNAKLEEVRGLAEHTFKEQALLKYELDRLKPSLLSQSNKILMNDLD